MSLTSFTTKLLSACFAIAMVACGNCFAEEADQAATTEQEAVIRVVLDENGTLEGRVFAMVGSEEAPMVAKVSLASEGKTVASGETDVIGNFSFSDVEPGTYTMVGVSGEYVGDQVVVVAANSEAVEEEVDGVYTSLALQVAPVDVYADASYASVPMDSYAAPVSSCGSCNSCGGGVSVGSSYSACGGGCGGGGILGGSSLRRLALLGTAVAIPVALSGDDDEMASPDE